jgi:predicted amidohydrolase
VISTALHIYNVDGAIYNLATAMSRFPYLGLSPSASGRDDDQQAGTLRPHENGIRILRIGACVSLMLMALREGSVQLTEASQGGW